MPDDLYERYQAAHRAYQQHAECCSPCTRYIPDCPEGARQRKAFERLQDAYTNRLKRPNR
ncbi:hypothetical protein ACGFX8_29650 [Streptomyces sp. NPDC048362]|uniref:hypothetical protein n=1 Tax=Streptomyces sp. NPDC048362 TaxID=3365539 RepID=UPI003718020A